MYFNQGSKKKSSEWIFENIFYKCS